MRSTDGLRKYWRDSPTRKQDGAPRKKRIPKSQRCKFHTAYAIIDGKCEFARKHIWPR